jgi:phosphonate metabolism-associated iron-containing alcohol dehydrogenase
MFNLEKCNLLDGFRDTLVCQDKLEEILNKLPSNGSVLVVSSKNSISEVRLNQFINEIGKNRVISWRKVLPNPAFSDVALAQKNLLNEEVECVVSIGAGSVIDTGKLFSILPSLKEHSLGDLLKNPHLLDCYRVLPHFAVPTTSGSGSEVTPFATVWGIEEGLKYSLDHKNLYPKYAILDPTLIISNSRIQTLYSGLDSISHALESLWNINRTPESESYAIKSLQHALNAFLKVLDDLGDLSLRKEMQLVSLYAGMAISRTRTAVAHAISYPLTMRYNVPHGLASGFSLVTLIKIYKEAEGANLKNQDIIEGINQMLLSLQLNIEILKYLEFNEAITLLSEMKNPQRFKNFAYKFEEKDIYKVLDNSFGN